MARRSARLGAFRWLAPLLFIGVIGGALTGCGQKETPPPAIPKATLHAEEARDPNQKLAPAAPAQAPPTSSAVTD